MYTPSATNRKVQHILVATLVDRQQSSGIHAATWSGRDDTGFPVSAGVYFARLEAADRTAVRKIVVVR